MEAANGRLVPWCSIACGRSAARLLMRVDSRQNRPPEILGAINLHGDGAHPQVHGAPQALVIEAIFLGADHSIGTHCSRFALDFGDVARGIAMVIGEEAVPGD